MSGWWRVSCKVGWHHDKEKATCQREDGEECWVDAYECIYEEKGKCLCRGSPGKETNCAILGNKGDSYARVEAPKVGGHDRQGEIGAVDILT